MIHSTRITAWEKQSEKTGTFGGASVNEVIFMERVLARWSSTSISILWTSLWKANRNISCYSLYWFIVIFCLYSLHLYFLIFIIFFIFKILYNWLEFCIIIKMFILLIFFYFYNFYMIDLNFVLLFIFLICIYIECSFIIYLKQFLFLWFTFLFIIFKY